MQANSVAQNIPPTPQAEFAALGFYGEPLDQMIHRSFEEQNQGLANAHGYKMISPYIDPPGRDQWAHWQAVLRRS